jgi:hypothetical protein
MWISYLIFQGYFQRCQPDGLLNKLKFVAPHVVRSKPVCTFLYTSSWSLPFVLFFSFLFFFYFPLFVCTCIYNFLELTRM